MKERLQLEGERALLKQIDKGHEKGNTWIREASRMSARPGDDNSEPFTLPSHIDANLIAEESTEAIVTFFSKISKEYTPIEQDKSAQWMEVKARLEASPCDHPVIEEHSVYENMKAAKKTGSVPGDIPVSILKEFLPEFTTPITAILREAVTSHEWPQVYKKEYHVPLKKIPTPQTEDDLRGIGLTVWASKQLERLVLNWIWPFIQPHLDPDQMGGRPGCYRALYSENVSFHP